jgi:two-component system NarL family sensor kinase
MDTHQAKLFTAIIISTIVIGTVIIYFVISITRQQKKNLRLQRKNIMAEINAIEKEQSRMAADLHDELGPLLTVAKYTIDGVEVENQDDKEMLIKASGHIDNALVKMREIARNLMPAMLIQNGLFESLRQLITHTNQVTPLYVTLSYEVNGKLSPEKTINIYRILSEIIQNAIKHSKAELLLIKITELPSALKIICEDNGIGYDYENMLAQDGLGLRNLKTRVDLLGGIFKGASVPGRGTQYIFEIPIS